MPKWIVGSLVVFGLLALVSVFSFGVLVKLIDSGKTREQIAKALTVAVGVSFANNTLNSTKGN